MYFTESKPSYILYFILNIYVIFQNNLSSDYIILYQQQTGIAWGEKKVKRRNRISYYTSKVIIVIGLVGVVRKNSTNRLKDGSLDKSLIVVREKKSVNVKKKKKKRRKKFLWNEKQS